MCPHIAIAIIAIEAGWSVIFWAVPVKEFIMFFLSVSIGLYYSVEWYFCQGDCQKSPSQFMAPVTVKKIVNPAR
jgi:hypothetical protein